MTNAELDEELDEQAKNAQFAATHNEVPILTIFSRIIHHQKAAQPSKLGEKMKNVDRSDRLNQA